MAISSLRPWRITASDELQSLIRRVVAALGQRRRQKQRARFWSEVQEGQREAATNAGGHAGPGCEKKFGIEAESERSG